MVCQVSNEEFINAIFGPDAPWCHVTDFIFDPANIPSSEHLRAWKGDYFSRYQFGTTTNQYFTISTFYADEQKVARRRKALYRQTHCIVLDDVREKLDEQVAQKLPEPSWIMETSAGSFQWGYILTKPETTQARIDNLNDGLIASDLAPSGKDPGQRGVTRYVRLPEGYNTKSSKMINGQPYKCQMISWNPFQTVTLEQLAAPFCVNLDAPRRESRVDGAKQIDDHPLLAIPDLIHIKEVRSEGRFDITCPWVDEHTGEDDSGTAIFTNGDGSIGFKCHHGSCQEKTGRDLLKYLERESPGFGQKFNNWQMINAFADVSSISFMNDKPSSSLESTTSEKQSVKYDTLTPENTNNASDITLSESVVTLPEQQEKQSDDILKQVLRQLRTEIPGSQQQIDLASKLLQQLDTLPEISKITWHNEVCDIMRWSKRDFERVIKDLRSTWYDQSKTDISFFDETIYVAEQNQFFDRRRRMWMTAEGYQNNYAHLDPEARKEALQGGRVTKVHKVDYAPKKPPVFEERGVVYGNAWHNEFEQPGVEGDVSTWLEHFDTLGWTPYSDHVLKWMAWTIQNPDIKINHMLLFGSAEGCGKDWLLYPLVQAMGDNHMTISGEELLEGFNDYVLSTKHLHINETELGDRNEALAVSAKLKPLAAAPPDKLRVNQKSVKKIEVRNLLSVSMTTNSQVPVRLTGESRRICALWSDLDVRDDWGVMKPEWKAFWKDAWGWMQKVGWQHCIWYLRNKVDISDFNPGEAPPVTDFLRDIVDASRTPMQQTLVRLIQSKMGPFVKDFVTIDEIVQMINMSANMHPDMIFVKPGNIQPNRISVALKELGKHYKLEAKDHNEAVTIWIIRNHEQYRCYTKTELMQMFKTETKNYKTHTQLSVAK